MAEDRQEPDEPKRSRRQLLRVGLVGLGAGAVGLLLSRTGRSRPAPGSAERLLLTPEDLGPEVHVTQRPAEHETRDGGRTALAAFTGRGVDLIESVVVFPSRDAARAALTGVRAQAAQRQGNGTSAAPEAGDETVMLRDRRRISVAFRDGPVLVHLSLAGDAAEARLKTYIEKAREKAAGRAPGGR